MSAAIFLEGYNQRWKYFAWCTLLVYLDVSRNTAKLYTEVQFSHVVELCCINGIKSSEIYLSDVPKAAVFRDASRYTSRVHHAKYLHFLLHRSRNIAADIGKTNEIHILLVCINFLY